MFNVELMVKIVCITMSIFLLIAAYSFIAEIRIKKRQLLLDEYEININAEIGDSAIEALDKLIVECFTEYIILNIEYKQIEYIDNTLENEITKGVANKLVQRISPSFITKLSLIYNTSNMVNLLSERVYLHTLDYTIKKNQIKDEE